MRVELLDLICDQLNCELELLRKNAVRNIEGNSPNGIGRKMNTCWVGFMAGLWKRKKKNCCPCVVDGPPVSRESTEGPLIHGCG